LTNGKTCWITHSCWDFEQCVPHYLALEMANKNAEIFSLIWQPYALYTRGGMLKETVSIDLLTVCKRNYKRRLNTGSYISASYSDKASPWWHQAVCPSTEVMFTKDNAFLNSMAIQYSCIKSFSTTNDQRRAETKSFRFRFTQICFTFSQQKLKRSCGNEWNFSTKWQKRRLKNCFQLFARLDILFVSFRQFLLRKAEVVANLRKRKL
jgi:hypothetical protein